MSIVTKAEDLWSKLYTKVQAKETTVTEAVTVTKAVVTAVHELHTGASTSILASIQKNYPEALPIIEDVASLVLGPEAGDLIALAVDVLAMSHPMTHAEEEAWFNRASQSSG